MAVPMFLTGVAWQWFPDEASQTTLPCRYFVDIEDEQLAGYNMEMKQGKQISTKIYKEPILYNNQLAVWLIFKKP